MPIYSYPAILFEKPKESAQHHTSVPQTNFTLQRLIDNHKRYWINQNPNPILKPKKLLIADCSARTWSERKILNVIEHLSQLMEDGFSLYVWQSGHLTLLTKDNLFYLREKEFRYNITKVPPEQIIKTALQEISRVGPDQLHVVDYYWMNYFLSDGKLAPPSESLTVYASEHFPEIGPNQLSKVQWTFDKIPVLLDPDLKGISTVSQPITKFNKVDQKGVTPGLITQIFRGSPFVTPCFTYKPQELDIIQELETTTALMYHEDYNCLMSSMLESLSISFSWDQPNISFEQKPEKLKVLRCIGSSDHHCSSEFFDKFLKHAKNLQSFIWVGVRFPKLELIDPMDFPNLKYVDLPLHITPESFVYLLGQSRQIESLTCIPLTQASIEQLHFSELKELVYTDRKDNDTKLSLANLGAILNKTSKLVNLIIDVKIIGSVDIDRPISLFNLKKFIIQKSAVDEKGYILHILSASRQLEHVDLSRMILNYNDAQQQYLADLLSRNPYMKDLALPKLDSIPALRTILLRCHQLRRLHISQCPALQWTVHTGFPRLAALECLEISNPTIEDLNYIVSDTIALEELILKDCIWHVNDQELFDFPRLTMVTFKGDCKIKKSNLEKLLRNVETLEVLTQTVLSHLCSIPLPRLKRIKLDNTQPFSDRQIESLLANMPSDARIEGRFSALRFNASTQDLKSRLSARGAVIQDDRPLHERFPIPVIAPVPETLYTSRTMHGHNGGQGGNQQSKSTPTRAQQNCFMDANTSADRTPEFHLTSVFFPVHPGQTSPEAHHMRIDVYQDLIVNPAPCDIDHAFELIKTGSPLIHPPLHPIQSVQTDDFFSTAQQQPPIVGHAGFYAKKIFTLDIDWQAMPSICAQEVMTHLRADEDVEVQYSTRDNLYYIRAHSRKTCTVEWLITVPTDPPMTLPESIAQHVARYQAFGKGALSIDAPDPSGQDYLTCIEHQAKGACRHRACAFKAFMAQNYPDIPVRIISNGCHMFVEVLYEGQWITCDLGGYPAKLTLDESNNPRLEQPRETTETICPERPGPLEVNIETDVPHVDPQRIPGEETFEHQEISRDVEPDEDQSIIHEQNQPNQEISQQEQDIMLGVVDALLAEFSTTFYYQKRLETWVHSDSEPSIETYYDQLGLPGKNHLVELGTTSDVNTLSLSLEQYWRAKGRPVYYIDSPDDIRCSGPFLATTGFTENGQPIGQLKRGPGGPLHTFLTTHHDDDPLVIVNYDAFEADDIVRLNSLLGKKRCADSTPVPPKATVVGLINVNKTDCYQGSDFYSRFHRVTQCLFSSQALHKTLPKLVHTVDRSNPEDSIDLFHASDWEAKLIGRWVLNQGQFHFEKGELVQALERKEQHITIQHGLWQDPTFVRFWQSLAVHKTLHYAGQSIDIPADFICFKPSCEAYDWPKLSRIIQRMPHKEINPDAQILNPSLLPQFFCHYQCDNASESLYPIPGIIQSAKAKGTLTVQVTRALSEDNWAMLLTACAKEKVQLQIDCPPSISLPWEEAYIAPEPARFDFDDVILAELNTAVVSSTDIDSTVAILQQACSPWIVLDGSEYEPSDLLKHIDHKFDKHLLRFKFKQKEAALVELLARGEHVILKGKFSLELFDHLSQLIHERFSNQAASGRLILVQDSKTQSMELPTLTHTVTAAKKLELLGLPATQMLLTQTQIEQESLNRLKTRLSQKNPWQGMEGLYPDIHISEPNLAHSHDIAQRFDRDRLHAVNARLRKSPYVFLTGLTSVGKTTFVEKMVTGKQGKLYRGEQALKRWALSQSRRRKILFIDEANFQEWSILEGLLNDPPGIVIRETYYPLTKDHKIIFAGNPLNYGDERKLAKLFHTYGNALIFNPMPTEYIYERIIKPVFPEALLGVAPEVSASWLAVYAFLCERSSQDVLISARELQIMALLTFSYHARNPEVPIEQVASYYAHHVAKHLVPTLYQTSFLHQFAEPEPLPSISLLDPDVPQRDFMLTASRQPLVNQLTELLLLRTYRRSEQACHEAQRYGGLGGIVIEGESGIGKSELVTTLLQQCGYAETHYSAPMQLDGNRFYRLSVDMDLNQKIRVLHQAFHEGSVVVIDEINSSPMMERLMNSLLMGETLKGERPIRPGFMIIGTQNPITLSGRRAPSNALSRRLMTVTLPPYPLQEMIDIVASKIGYERATYLVTAYEEQRAYAAANNKKPIPTFRDVIKIADEEAGIVHTSAPLVEVFESELSDEEDAEDNMSVVSDLSEQEWSDWDDGDSEDSEIALETPVINDDLQPSEQSSAMSVAPDSNHVVDRARPLVVRPNELGSSDIRRNNWSFYLQWITALIFAILAMIVLCLALNVGMAPAVGMGPLAMKLGTSLLVHVTPVYLSLCYAAVGLISGLISVSFFKMTKEHQLRKSPIEFVPVQLEA